MNIYVVMEESYINDYELTNVFAVYANRALAEDVVKSLTPKIPVLIIQNNTLKK